MPNAGRCRTVLCSRLAQLSGLVKGYCCVICQAKAERGFFAGKNHAAICDLIEEAGRAELEIQDNIVLGYD